MTSSSFRAATTADVPALLLIQKRFYEDEHYPFDATAAERTMRQLMTDPSLGRLFVTESAGGPVGYLAVTFGFSLEFGGRDAFVDELYILPEGRGRGLGMQALAVAENACAEAGVAALHLEVEHANPRARALYSRSGFVEHSRHLMTKRLGPLPMSGNARREMQMVVSFVDLTRFDDQSRRVTPRELADTIDGYYERVGAAVLRANGTVVKYIGDAALIVFGGDAVDDAVEMLPALKADVDDFMQEAGWPCRLMTATHIGPVMAGPFGLRDAKQFDVIGETVNTTARLKSPGVAVSRQVFDRLREDLRQKFVQLDEAYVWEGYGPRRA